MKILWATVEDEESGHHLDYVATSDDEGGNLNYLKLLQATVEEEGSGPAKQIGKLIGVDPDILIDNFVQPKIKVMMI